MSSKHILAGTITIALRTSDQVLYDQLRENRISFVDLNHDDVAVVELGSHFTGMPQLALPVTLLQSDFIVSVPKLKTHHWAVMTASMKNFFGALPGAVYGWPKNILHVHGITQSILDLNAVVRDLQRMLGRLIGEDIELHTNLAPDVGAVQADPGQLQQAIVNLVVNARDAMPDGGVLELRTAPTTIDEEHARTRPGLLAGEYVMLVVTDSGAGMPPEVREHIFEPFFSTKPKGKGTGLGLSTVYGIVRQSGGDISVVSELGQGTTFRIYLPVKGKVAPAPEHPEGGPVTGIHTGGGNETILLVEDEAPVREVTRRALAGVGYAVIVARDGKEALEIESRQSDSIDLVRTDMILPGMS